MPLNITHQYFKIAKEHEAYHGLRFFRVTVAAYEVLQVVLSPGSETRRGRSNTIGIYLISQSTFYSNYLPYGYAVPCSEKEFLEKASKVLGAFFPKQIIKKKK